MRHLPHQYRHHPGRLKGGRGFLRGQTDRQTRKVRWEQLDEVLAYGATDLDQDVVAPDQIRTVLATFRDKDGGILNSRLLARRPNPFLLRAIME